MNGQWVKRILACVTLTAAVGAAGFAEDGYRTFTDKDKGISFLYPETATVKVGDSDVTIVLAGDMGDMEKPLAAIALGVIRPEDEEVNALDEKGFIDFTASGDESVSLLSGPSAITAAGVSWQQAKFSFFNGRMRLTVRKVNGVFFGIVFLTMPEAMESGYEKAFSVFLSSLHIDMDRWFAGVEKK